MRVPLAVVAVVAALGLAVPVQACNFDHGNVALGLHVPPPVFALVEQLAPGTIPNGLFYYTSRDGATGGAMFSLRGDDGESPLIVGDTDSCPGGSGDAWVLCAHLGDWDIQFSCPGHANRAGDEYGIVPCSGSYYAYPTTWAFTAASGEPVHLDVGTSLGEGYTYSEC